MILGAHQPQYLPWLGYFDKIDRADVFVLLDNVQFKKNEWQNRNRIKGASGWQWLTVPVHHRFPQPIHEVGVADQKWQRKHRRTLEQCYGGTSFFQDQRWILDALYDREWDELVSLNMESVRLLTGRFGIETPVHIGSDIDGLPENPDERLIALCRRFGADTYLAGAGGQAYMDLSLWQEAGIQVVFQELHHPVYPQPYGPFLPALSAVDLLFNCGADGFNLVRRARREAA
jgi:hypothetical protein